MKSVVILSNYRCGTTNLYAIFVNNGYPDRFHEIINRLGKSLSKEHVEERQNEFERMRKHILDTSGPCTDLWYQSEARMVGLPVMERHYKLVDAKIRSLWEPDGCVSVVHRHQLRQLYHGLTVESEAERLYGLFGDVQYIHLHRMPEASAVSFYIARHYHQFNSTEPKKKDTPPPYDYHAINILMDYFGKQWKWPDVILDSLGAHRIAYEDTVNRPEEVLSRFGINNFWQTDFTPVPDPLKQEYLERFLIEQAASKIEQL